LGQRLKFWYDGLRHKEQGNQPKLIHRLGDSRTEDRNYADARKGIHTEWGLGQVLPLKKDFSRLLQLGLIGYDQWQVSANGGTIGNLPASSVPFYSVHAVGLQSNYILPTKNLDFFFKYLNEYKAISRPEGRTIVFGG
jgi:hypothetical protein